MPLRVEEKETLLDTADYTVYFIVSKGRNTENAKNNIS